MIFLAGACVFNGLASTVPLQGKLMGGSMKNPDLTPQVEVYQYSASIELSFLCNLGILSIEVLDETGALVYQTKVNATAGSDLPIDTSNWASGEYTLVITDGLGGCLEGNFVI